MQEQKDYKALNLLYRMAEAGEKGFATAAANVQQRELKVLFKTYARQRADFKTELLAAMEGLSGLDGKPNGAQPRSSLFGMIHRGRVAIFSAMTIEDDQRQKVILNEVAFGERYALNAYRRALDGSLSSEVRALIERQQAAVQEVQQKVAQLRGVEGKRLVMRLYDHAQEAEHALRRLERAGFRREDVEKVTFDSSFDTYATKGATVQETVLSGAFGGALWGSLAGALIGFGAVQANLPEVMDMGSGVALWALVLLLILAIGALVGAVLGYVIGTGITQEDRYQYNQSVRDGKVFVEVLAEDAQAHKASQILRQATGTPGEREVGAPASV